MSDHLPGARGAVAWMTQHSVAANLAMVIVIVAGLLGMSRIKQEVFPEFDLDMVVVAVPYPGASPAEVEQGIVLAVEESVRGLDGVKRVHSVSDESIGQVTVELLVGANTQKALSDVKSAVDRIQSFPDDAEDPSVTLATRKREVVSLVVAGDLDMTALHALGERMRTDLLESPDITQVEVFGVPAPEVGIEIDRSRLEAYGLTLDDVAAQIRFASLELPGGSLETPSGDVLVRVADRKLTGTQFGDIVLRSGPTGAEVRLEDIATVRDGFAETDQASYFNGQPAVRVTAYRVGDETPTGVSDAVRAYAEKLETELPAGLTVAIWNDDSNLLRQRIDLLVRNAKLGFALVLVILALFLEARLAFWVGLGIPISFLGAFLLMPIADVSINMISLFALIITLGMVVDDAIVVGENIYQKREKGIAPMKAAIEGAREMVTPVSFAILTTGMAFAPMLVVPGTMGKVFSVIPLVVLAVLFFSLLESFFVLPAHLAHMGDEAESRKGVFGYVLHLLDIPRIRMANALKRFTEERYKPALHGFLTYRYAALATAVVLFMATVAIVRGGLIPFTFLPKMEADLVRANAKLPYGAPTATTNAVREEIESALQRIIEEHGWEDDVKGVFARLGEGAETREGRDVGSHLVSVEVELVESGERDFTAATMADLWTQELPELAGLRSLTMSYSIGIGGGAAVDVQLSHEDIQVLADASQDVTMALRGFETLTDIENTYASGKPQFDYHLTSHGRALGLTSQQIARQIRSSFYGAEALREQRGRQELKVMVRLPEAQRVSEYDVEQLRVRTPQGTWTPLSYVADFDRQRAPTDISREDGRRVVNVSAALIPGAKSSREVVEALESDILPALTLRYPGLETSLVGEQRDQMESLSSLGKNYVLAMIMIYALLAIPFRSYVQPLIVMSAIPFGIVGAVAGHIVMGYGLSIISVMGIIALSGVVVNDSLVLIDAANTAMREGMAPLEAIEHAGAKRLRPILLTSLTTFFGLLPMIFEPSVQARFLIPMALSLGYGVLFATVIVLLIVPGLFMASYDLRAVCSRFFSRLHHRPEEAAAK